MVNRVEGGSFKLLGEENTSSASDGSDEGRKAVVV